MNFLLRYLRYLVYSKNLHGIHSPFVYSLVKDIIYSKYSKPKAFDAIESIRQAYKKDFSPIDNLDYGAASKFGTGQNTISRVCYRSAKSKKYAQLLFRLAKWHNPDYAIELGTSLGISAMYQATGFSENTQFTTIEGHPGIALKAENAMKAINIKHVNIVTGNFNHELPKLLANLPQVDWVFFDGNHKKAPTLQYFEQCLAKASKNALFIFDDINWSDEMRQTWIELKKHPKVFITIDLFFMGLVFLNPREQKEQFTIRF